jgi:hypothetical protein
MSFEEFEAMSNDGISQMCSYMFADKIICWTVYYSWSDIGRWIWSDDRDMIQIGEFYNNVFWRKLLKWLYVDSNDNVYEFKSTIENFAEYSLSRPLIWDYMWYDFQFWITDDWQLLQYQNLTKIETSIEEYRQQKEEEMRLEMERRKEEERIRIEKQRKLLLPWLIDSMTQNINSINKKIKIELAEEILNYQINILKSKWLIIPILIRNWLIHCEW